MRESARGDQPLARPVRWSINVRSNGVDETPPPQRLLAPPPVGLRPDAGALAVTTEQRAPTRSRVTPTTPGTRGRTPHSGSSVGLGRREGPS